MAGLADRRLSTDYKERLDWQHPLRDEDWEELLVLSSKVENLREWYKDSDVMTLAYDFSARHANNLREKPEFRGVTYHDIAYDFAYMLYHRSRGWYKENNKLVGLSSLQERIECDVRDCLSIIWDMWRD